MKTDKPKSAKCRFCGAEYGFTEANRHLLLPFMCWRCTDLANAEWMRIQANRRREQIPFTRL